MVSFPDVIPYFLWGLIGIGLVLVAVFGGRLIRSLFRFLSQVKEFKDERNSEKMQEGPWWYFAEIVRLLIFAIIIVVVVIILNYLLNSPADVTIYHLVLGTWTGPIVSFILIFYLFKSIPHVVRKKANPPEVF